jgi:hypothetical protein
VPSTNVADLSNDPTAPQAAGTVEETANFDSADADRAARTVQFTAPGGTRIIWTLDPDFDFPVTEPDTGARGEM